MSYVTDRYRLERISGRSLSVSECGIQICHSGHATPTMRYRDYSAHFILEGKGIYYANGKEYPLSAGQGFMITPDTVCSYTADVKEPWKYVYVSFFGPDSTALARNAGICNEDVTFDFPLSEDMIEHIYAMHAAGKKNEARGYDVTGYLLLVMSRLISARSAPQQRTNEKEKYVDIAKQYVEDNYTFDITVADLASHVCIDRTYLYRLFLKYEGRSPSRDLAEYRLSKAATALEDSRQSISDVALSSGFSDLSHFYKAFSAKYGMTPKKYRETCTKEK